MVILVMTAKMKKDVLDVQRPTNKIFYVMQNCFVFFVMGITLHLLMSVLEKKFKREVERISIGSAKRQVMGANRSENSSYAAAIKKIKHVKRKVVVDRVHPLKNVNQS